MASTAILSSVDTLGTVSRLYAGRNVSRCNNVARFVPTALLHLTWTVKLETIMHRVMDYGKWGAPKASLLNPITPNVI